MQENKDRLLRLLQQYKELGIAEQIDFDKSMTDSLIANSLALVDSDYDTATDDIDGKWSIKPSLAEKSRIFLSYFRENQDERKLQKVARNFYHPQCRLKGCFARSVRLVGS